VVELKECVDGFSCRSFLLDGITDRNCSCKNNKTCSLLRLHKIAFKSIDDDDNDDSGGCRNDGDNGGGGGEATNNTISMSIVYRVFIFINKTRCTYCFLHCWTCLL